MKDETQIRFVCVWKRGYILQLASRFFQNPVCATLCLVLFSVSTLTAQSPPPAEDIEDIIELGSTKAGATLDDSIDLKEPPLWTGWYWIGGGMWVLILALGFLLMRKRKDDPAAVVTMAPPHERALKFLRKIWNGQADLDDKDYAFALSDVLRRYIEEAFSVRAPERTTEEFLEEASQHEDLKGEFAQRLDEFLSLVDLVKFARMPLERARREELHQAAVQFVEESHQASLLKISPELSVAAQTQLEVGA